MTVPFKTPFARPDDGLPQWAVFACPLLYFAWFQMANLGGFFVRNWYPCLVAARQAPLHMSSGVEELHIHKST